MLSDFQFFFIVRIRNEFAMTLSLKIPPCLKCVASFWPTLSRCTCWQQ